MKARWVLLLLFLAACDGKKAGTSPELDVGPPGEGVSDTVTEVVAPDACAGEICFIGDVCYQPGEVDPDDPCSWCDPDTRIYAWSPRPEGASCIATRGNAYWGIGPIAPERTCNDGACCTTELVCTDGWCDCNPDRWFGGCFTECEFLASSFPWREPDYCVGQCGPPCCLDDTQCGVDAARCVPVSAGWNPSGRCVSVLEPPACWTDDDCAEGMACQGVVLCDCWEDCPDLGPGWCGDAPACGPPKPFLLDGACVECLASADCADDLHCNPKNHRCEVEECDYCESPYPVCVQINGVWSCVQCKYDEDCPPGVPCDEDLHACAPWPSDDYCPPCDSDADCVALNQWLEVDCHSASGCCFDRNGRCDGLSVGCPEGTCVPIWEELGCGTTSDPEEFPCAFFPPHLGVCTCEEPFFTPRIIGCPDEDCGLGCPGEAACAGPSFLEDFGIAVPSGGGICFPVDR